jgi:hypothetical protein
VFLRIKKEISEMPRKGILMKDDDKKDNFSIEMLEEHRDHMIMDALLRLTALENILMRKNITTDEEIKSEILVLSSAIAKTVSEKLTGKIDPSEAIELEKWVDDFASNKKKGHNSN